MIVCIAEKPSVAREIANVLGANRRMDGYFEGNGYQVTWTFGHFCQLREPEDYRPEWKRWSIHDLPMLPDSFGIKLMRRDDGVVRQFNVIKNLLAAATEVVNCGDAGQEGEVIQRWVLTEAKYRKPFKRLWISSLTEEAIRQGFANLREGSEFDRLYQAGKSRAVGDWLLGLNATRLFTLKYAAGQKQVLSIGRVQTPTLALLVDRYHEIQNFKPEPYWVLRTEYRGTMFSHVAPPKKGKADDDEPDGVLAERARLRARGYFVSQEEADAGMAAVRGAIFTVTGVEIKKALETPPSLFDLTSLQVQCNNQLGLSAEDTLKTVQGLYEKKVVSYPRVDTTFLPDDQYPKIAGIMRGLGGYSGLTAPLLEGKIRKSTKVFNNNKVTDHHAIIPTGASAGGLGGTESSVYDIIVRRFLAAFYPDCEVSNTTVTGEAAAHPFRVRGRQILNPGWRIVYGDPEKQQAPSAPKAAGEGDDDVVNTVLPSFTQGENGPHKPRLDQKVTQPPREYTEAMLLRGMETAGRNVDDEELRQAMKENGIGRPSTRAAIIETLFKRGYIRRDKKKILPTPTGVELIGLIRNPTLKSAELTGQWEQKLRQIEAGNLDSDQFLGELKTLVREMVLEVKADGSGRGISVSAPGAAAAGGQKSSAPAGKKPPTAAKPAAPAVPGSLGACPVCGQGYVLRGKTAFGCSRWREGCALRLPGQFEGKILTDKQVSALLGKGRTPVIKGFIDDVGQKFDAAVRLTPQHTLELVRAAESKPATTEAPQQIPCPVCRLGTMLRGKTAYGCSRFREDCQFRVPLELCGRTLTEAQIAQLLRRGKTGVIRGFTSQRTGQKFEAALQLAAEGKVEFVFEKK
ncbi:DNA topoisomerase III [Hymenobacter roseosalivarius DSM 11622]|uniref:DNA topoisomerase n=1 Tax=Hymenobacter roseosalivarius DSM 11622 TaxID=645990 RepID=A0A1W1VHP3_9BACT|nr:type IA DNA topoisomerase [Hymenobacter roseosalivarius]SMB92846.1 DNA topoisomerase III [Hymenobacter roseosalivarius DSM 11622]